MIAPDASLSDETRADIRAAVLMSVPIVVGAACRTLYCFAKTEHRAWLARRMARKGYVLVDTTGEVTAPSDREDKS